MEFNVIGGGPAGLAAAIELARGGGRVRLIEQHHELGGRAGTVVKDGFSLNFGPHAVYLQGFTYRTLTDWGIMPSGSSPVLGDRGAMVRHGRRHGFVRDIPSLAFSTFLNPLEKVEAAAVVSKLRASTPGAGAGLSMAQWLDLETRSAAVRDFAQALVRVSTYCGQPEMQSAEVVLEQLGIANRGGVTYVDGGWQSMIGAMAACARSLGVEIETGVPAKHVPAKDVPNNDATQGTVLAVSPHEVEHLTGRKLPAMTNIRMACLDLCLTSLPEGSAVFALGLDQPLYLSVHSEWVKVAPPGKALVHVAKYKGGEAADAAGDRTELENFADLLLPGWRNRAEYIRFLPEMTVSHAVTGLTPRPDVDALGLDGVRIAGDWVGPEGMLADAAVASGVRAARSLLSVAA
ncbi:MAG: FAD-dependent oxidoreductase [Acidobacteriota bacterium]